MSSHMGSRPVADAAVTASCFSLRPAKLCHPEMKRRATFQSSTKCFSEIYQKKKKKKKSFTRNHLPQPMSVFLSEFCVHVFFISAMFAFAFKSYPCNALPRKQVQPCISHLLPNLQALNTHCLVLLIFVCYNLNCANFPNCFPPQKRLKRKIRYSTGFFPVSFIQFDEVPSRMACAQLQTICTCYSGHL